MLEKLAEIEARFDEVNEALANPLIMNDIKQMRTLGKELKELGRIVDAAKKYRKIVANIDSARAILQETADEDLRELAKEELALLEPRFDAIENDIKNLLIPQDPDDSKNTILEIRAGTGGDEAALFAGDLFRMYQRYAEVKGWKFEVSDFQEGTMGGFKEIIVAVSGEDCYGHLKFESGVHRVQRVPQTEQQGRIHTSAASVAALPEPEEFEIEIKDSDLRKDTFCSSGNGGQSVNTTYSAVRLTHIPTGVVVSCQDERSQIKNMDKAMKTLRAKLYDIELTKRSQETAAKRKSLVSTGDRSAKIRTYNFPQSRLTDHRIGLTLYNLPMILDGNLNEVIETLRIAENTERLKEGAITI
ncbi:MAG: peptide chain release factor 1 [Bacteroidia bacterium]|nr:peptide chain release factor 1 [Bacteroidia bacterium]